MEKVIRESGVSLVKTLFMEYIKRYLFSAETTVVSGGSSARQFFRNPVVSFKKSKQNGKDRVQKNQ